MFFDLNISVPAPAFLSVSAGQSQSKKGKQKQSQPQPPATADATSPLFSTSQIAALEARIEVLVHLGYTVFALNQTIQSVYDPKKDVNVLDPLISQLKKRPGIVFLKRLTLVLDEASEKGFGFTKANEAGLTSYDLLSLHPTTQATLSLAILSHTVPSPTTAHIISLPLTLPRLPFFLKHTIVGTALKNGAVFEFVYSSALGDAHERRNWFGSARELARVTHGKGIIFSSGTSPAATNNTDLRGPADIINLATLLGIAQNLGRDAITSIPKSVVLRAQTRKTFRAVLSEPRLVLPEINPPPAISSVKDSLPDIPAPLNGKRPREEDAANETGGQTIPGAPKKKRKNKGGAVP